MDVWADAVLIAASAVQGFATKGYNKAPAVVTVVVSKDIDEDGALRVTTAIYVEPVPPGEGGEQESKVVPHG
jgi:hypothetical protein